MRKTVHAGGVNLAVTEAGSGEPLLLVHGFPLNATMWAQQIDAFARTHRVIAPDLRGFGDSAATVGEVTMERLADDLADLLDAMGIRRRVVLCGLSMGGYIAFAFWHRHRERLRALVLADTRAAGDTPQAAQDRRELADRVAREGPKPLVEQMLPKLLGPTTFANHPDLVATVREMMLTTSAEGAAAAARGLARRTDWTGRLGEIELPVLVIVGEADVISPPPEMRALAEAMPQARYVEVPTAGHMAPLENPAAFNEALTKFLKSLP